MPHLEEYHRFTDCTHYNDKFTLEQNQKDFKKQDREKGSKTETALRITIDDAYLIPRIKDNHICL
jgi:hypothetical protein